MRHKSYLKGLGLGIFVTALIMSLSSGTAKGEMSDEEIIKRAEKLGMVSENAMLLTEAQNLADNARDKSLAQEADKEEKEAAAAVSDNTVSQNVAVSDNGEILKPESKASDSSRPGQTGVSDKEDRASVAGAGTPEKEEKKDTEQAAKEKASAAAAAEKEKASADARAAAEKEAKEKKPEADDDSASGQGTGESVTITVNSGDSSLAVASKMVQAGLISDARQFDSYLVLSGYDRRLVIGSHPIPKGSTPEEMGRLLTTKQ